MTKNRLLEQVRISRTRLKILLSINTEEMYEVIVYLPIILNLLSSF